MCTLPEALAVTRAAAEAGAQLQATFEMALNKALQGQASPQKTERILRILDILSATCGQSCWNSFQVELMAYPDKSVRSKAALLIGRSTRNVAWIARRLLDRDPRVQASAVEALWGLDAEEVETSFSVGAEIREQPGSGERGPGPVSLLAMSPPCTSCWTCCGTPIRSFGSRRFGLSAKHKTSASCRFWRSITSMPRESCAWLRLAPCPESGATRKPPRQSGPLQVHMSQAAAQADGLRRLAFALSCHPARDLSGIKPTEFAVWENGTLIEEYQVRLVNPAGAFDGRLRGSLVCFRR